MPDTSPEPLRALLKLYNGTHTKTEKRQPHLSQSHRLLNLGNRIEDPNMDGHDEESPKSKAGLFAAACLPGDVQLRLSTVHASAIGRPPKAVLGATFAGCLFG